MADGQERTRCKPSPTPASSKDDNSCRPLTITVLHLLSKQVVLFAGCICRHGLTAQKVKILSKSSKSEEPCIASAEVLARSASWLGRGLSCVCAQRGENDACS
ncbi:uncharacterized protein LOC131251312 [Magnolia sinica]|uniref:uncharacterized protein LOC131251312 n=1 Tax=Magnolia sinica TaxID=86752 RepID=UPI00265B303F|nr:uncharacterized protein LOC131251312 [Magnolia sinica]XP_058107945.1 uncharacterized protein LOC131251312 [Magnolia sinica]XP_058107946.1 uncharacterized protein LOC131251312 [Magnolia sinica]